MTTLPNTNSTVHDDHARANRYQQPLLPFDALPDSADDLADALPTISDAERARPRPVWPVSPRARQNADAGELLDRQIADGHHVRDLLLAAVDDRDALESIALYCADVEAAYRAQREPTHVACALLHDAQLEIRRRDAVVDRLRHQNRGTA